MKRSTKGATTCMRHERPCKPTVSLDRHQRSVSPRRRATSEAVPPIGTIMMHTALDPAAEGGSESGSAAA